MSNARSEFISHISNREILCCHINIDKDVKGYELSAILTTGYTKEEYDVFLKDINVDYDSGYGSQNLFGTIWYKDGTWSERDEYDGSESWRHMCVPNIPKELIRQDKVRDQLINKIID